MIDTYYPYTIYCEHGRNLTGRRCYFYIGQWLGYNPNYVILCHGKLSKEEYEQYQTQPKINLFEDVVNRTVDIFARISTGYLNKLGRNGKGIESYIQFVGALERDPEHKNLWRGYIERK